MSILTKSWNSKIIFITLITFAWVSTSWSADSALISAQLKQLDRYNGAIILDISSTAPATLIVELVLPNGNRIVHTSPNASKRNKKQNSVKWLLKNTSAGEMEFLFQTDKSFTPSDCSVTLRYKDRASNKLTEQRVPIE